MVFDHGDIDFDFTKRLVVFDGVVAKVVDHLVEDLRVAVYHSWFSGKHQCDLIFLCHILQTFYHIGGKEM